LKAPTTCLIAYAQARGKELRYFERIEQQLELLTRIDDGIQIKALKTLIDSLPQAAVHEEECSKPGQGRRGAIERAYRQTIFVGHAEAKKAPDRGSQPHLAAAN